MLTLLERQKLSFLARVCSSVIFVLCPMNESSLEAVRRPVCPLGHRLWPLTSLCTAGHSSFPNLVLLCFLVLASWDVCAAPCSEVPRTERTISGWWRLGRRKVQSIQTLSYPVRSPGAQVKHSCRPWLLFSLWEQPDLQNSGSYCQVSVLLT